jgi:hypothetical protein
MKILQKICFVLLMATFLSSCSTTPRVYGISCFVEPYDVDDCRVLAEQGDTSALYNLGLMYVKGQVALQGDVMDFMYWGITHHIETIIAIEIAII